MIDEIDEEDIEMEEEEDEEEEVQVPIIKTKRGLVKLERKDTKSDMQNCFGFDDDEDVEVEKDETVSSKGTIKLVHAVAN